MGNSSYREILREAKEGKTIISEAVCQVEYWAPKLADSRQFATVKKHIESLAALTDRFER